jgi:hypothetical protein
MKCANILIVYFDENDDETKEARRLLMELYKERSRNQIKYSHGLEGAACFVTAEPEWKQTVGDTGIYVLQHGGGDVVAGTSSGFTRHLAEEPVRKAFAKWLVSLTGAPRSLTIKKLCFIACVAIQTDGLKARAVSAEGGKKGEIYVQQICHAISEIDTEKKLDGLMVAGYAGTVSIVQDPRTSDESQPNPNPIFKATQRLVPQKPDEALSRPIHPAQDEEKQTWKTGVKEIEKKIENYVKAKRIFVLNDRKWRAGAISDYTDKDGDWQKAWKQKLQKLEAKSGVFS